MHCFHLFALATALFQRCAGVGIDAIRALFGMGHGQGDEGFFSSAQFAFGKNLAVPAKNASASSGASSAIAENCPRSSGS